MSPATGRAPRTATARRRAGRRTALAAVAAAAALTAATGCSADSGPELEVSGAFIPEPASESVAGGFLTVQNTGDEDDALTGASSELAETVEVHETVDNAMRAVESLAVPAGGTLELARGGNHLMLLELSHIPEVGEQVTVELHFEKSESITVDVPVEPATHTGR